MSQTHETPNTRAALLAVRLPLSPTITTREPATRCSIEGLRLHASEMGCSRYTWYSAARASTPVHGDSLTHGSNKRRQTRVQPCSPPSVADDHHASLPLDARSRHCDCTRVRWGAGRDAGAQAARRDGGGDAERGQTRSHRERVTGIPSTGLGGYYTFYALRR